MSPSAETNITVTSDPDAEIFIVRGDFQRVDSSVGSLTTNHPLAPGLYKIKVVRADKVAERLIELPADGDSFDLRVESGKLESALPNAADYGNTPERIDQIDGFLKSLRQPESATDRRSVAGSTTKGATAQARAVTGTAATPAAARRTTTRRAELVLAASIDSGLQAWLPTVRVLPYGDPDAPLDKAASVFDPAKVQGLPLPGHELRAVWATLVPGIYRVIGTVNGKPMQIAVPLVAGKQTRVFVRRRNCAEAGDFSQQEWADLAVQMREPDASFILGEGDDYSEVVRHALAKGRPIIVSGPRVTEMLEAKYADPLVGIAGAHLMLDALKRKENPTPGRTLPRDMEFGRSDIGRMLENMRRPDVLGDHADLRHPTRILPDIVALCLRAQLIGRRFVRVSQPPLFWASWQALQDPGSGNVLLAPALLRAAGSCFAWGPYLVFTRPVGPIAAPPQ